MNYLPPISPRCFMILLSVVLSALAGSARAEVTAVTVSLKPDHAVEPPVVEPAEAGSQPADGEPAAADHGPAQMAPTAEDAPKPDNLPPAKNSRAPLKRLLSVRVRPYAQFVRVVLLFEAPTAYALRRDPLNNRLYLDLIGTSVPYFPGELYQIEDSRLSGIGLDASGPELATLEFRLRGRTEIDDFTVLDPSAIVIDIRQSGDDAARLPSSPGVSVAIKPEGLGRPVLPEQLAFTRDAAASSAAGLVSEANLPGDLASSDSMTSVTAKVAEAQETAPEVSDEPVETAHRTDFPSETLTAVYGAPALDELEGFPLEDIKPRDPRTLELKELFRQQRWGAVLTGGIKLLEDDPATRDLQPLLYMLAEARFRLDRQTQEQPSADAINFYEQALRANDAGRLGAFARWRLGAMMRDLQRYPEARFHLEQAQKQIGPAQSPLVRLDLARILARLGERDAAIELIRRIRTTEIAAPTLLEAAMLEARLLHEAGQTDEAWRVLEHADRVEPEWWKRSIERADLYSRVVDARGDLDQAYDVLFFAAYYFADQADKHPEVFLRYADLVRRLRDRALDEGRPKKAGEYDEEARLWYSRVLRMVDAGELDSAGLREAKARMAGIEGGVYGRGLASYALYLMGRGETIEAMKQLEKALAHTRLDGGKVEDLREPAGQILEPFMEWAAGQGRWDDAIGAWSSFGELLKEGPARNAALARVAEAMLHIGSAEGALAIVEQLEQSRGQGGVPPEDLLFIWKADALIRLGRTKEVLPRLEEIAAARSLTGTRLDALKVLARAYRQIDRPLRAAQVLEEIARTVELPAEERGQAWTEAGRLYLEEGMIPQATELALRGLIFEEDHARGRGERIWSDLTARELRMLLAESYIAAGDDERAAVALEDVLALPKLPEPARLEAEYLLAQVRVRRGEIEAATEALREVRDAEAVDPVIRAASTEALTEMRWDPAAEYEERIRNRMR